MIIIIVMIMIIVIVLVNFMMIFLSNLERLLSESEPASEVCSHGLEMKLLELSSL